MFKQIEVDSWVRSGGASENEKSEEYTAMLTTDSQVQTIHDLLTSAKDMYHQLVLIVGPSGSGRLSFSNRYEEVDLSDQCELGNFFPAA